MSENFRDIDPIGFRIEAGPNISQVPELLGGMPELPSRTSAVALGAIVASSEVLKPQNTDPSELEV